MKSTPFLLAAIVVWAGTAGAQSEGPILVQGRYENAAEGYAVTIPDHLVGVTGDQAGPERGFSILLPSKGAITVFGEPNSLEFRTPEEGVRHAFSLEESTCRKVVKVESAKLGLLKAARGTLTCGDRTLTQVLAFRPGGEPIYWLRMDSVVSNMAEDVESFNRLAESFGLIEWK